MSVLIQVQNLKCCAEPDWKPKVYACSNCHTKVEGNFPRPEFSMLDADELHFLRIFLWAEGRIKDMEGPLGMSYPTIRTRLSGLRAKLFDELPPEAVAGEDSAQKKPSSETVASAGLDSASGILDQLSQKKISFEEAMKRLEKISKGK